MMALSVEQERDSYKEKVEHMKMMIIKYKQEIQTQKIRKEGVETVSKLLHESREENANLTKKNVALEMVVRNLQSRLSLYGISDGMALEEGDMFIPGSSKQLLDNLARENKRLRSLLQGASTNSTDPEEINRLQQIIESKNAESEQFRGAITELSSKLQSSDQLMRACDCDKLIEIQKLRDKISTMKNECETRDILCSSLTEETNTIKQQLHDVAGHCQQLAVKLERSEKSKSKSSDQTEVEKLLEENSSLKDKLGELVKMNKRWQEYMSQKERYWQQIETSQPQQQHIEAINAALEDASRRLHKIEREKKQLQEELDERNQQLISKSGELTQLQSDVQCGHIGHDDSDAETISALKAQIQICTEDFESERRDREKAQNRVTELETELSQYNRVRQDEVRTPHQNLFEQRDTSSPEVYGNFNLPSPYNRESQLAARGPSRNRYDMYNVVDAIQTDSGNVSKNDKTDKEGSNLATKLQVDQTESTTANLLATVPDLNDFNSVDSDTDLERIKTMEIEMRNVGDLNLTHCPRCDQSFELGHEQETREHLEKCCD